MYPFLHELLADKKGGANFTCFDPCHLLWIALTVGAAALLGVYLGKQEGRCREKALGNLIALGFGLYILDFFLMPLAYGEIDLEKLPFHACTTMCVLCFLSGHNHFLRRFRSSFALLGFVSNFVYLIYPAGVMWHGVHPWCYRVLQTLAFHAVLSVYCLLALIFGETGCWKHHLAVTTAMTAWAVLGNYVYNTEARVYNWFFVIRDPFGILPADVSPFVMPGLNLVLFFALELAVCAVLGWLKGGKACATKA